MGDEIICYCKKVSKKTIQKAIKNGAKNLSYIQKMTGACTGNQCKKLNPKKRCCSKEILDILKNKSSSPATKNTCCCSDCH